MSQKKRAGSRHNDTTGLPHYQSPEALLHASYVVPNDYNDWGNRAATPLDNDGSAISNAELAFSPLLIGTDANIGATALPETPTRQGSQLSDADIILAAHYHGPFLDLLSSTEVAQNGTRPDLLISSLRVSDPPTQIKSPLDPSHVDFLQQAFEPTCFAVRALQHSQHPSFEFEGLLESNKVSVDHGIDATGSTAQTYTPPILPEGTGSHTLSLEHPGVPNVTSISASLEPGIPRVCGNVYAAPEPSGPTPKSKKMIRSSRKQRVITKGLSQHISSGCKFGGTPQRLACHFYKYDPGTYFSCGLSSFDTIGHLTQHLKQKHSLNSLPNCPRIRAPVEKKWHWIWNKMFGEGPPSPPCPYSHPVHDIQDHQYQAQSPELSSSLVREESRGEAASGIDIAEIADVPPHDLDWSNLYNAADVSPRESL
ncbi:hypothetical protein NPX13_g6938 [Xylaria arbuscula]|uniref:Uncharacterized protein n=1 Tax=Xylaria arbuscula TaxID=114810 RepID=A0A9W8NBM0_9PEZI|nr:hypothetical protein NPX13_g6938 [Xylaria arbuscula]